MGVSRAYAEWGLAGMGYLALVTDDEIQSDGTFISTRFAAYGDLFVMLSALVSRPGFLMEVAA